MPAGWEGTAESAGILPRVKTDVVPERHRYLDLDFDERQATVTRLLEGREASLQQRKRCFLRERSYHKLSRCHGDRDGLCKFLTHHFGSVERGWRLGLDIRVNGRVSLHDFTRALRDIGFSHNITKLWQSISNGADHLTFAEVDPDSCAQFDWFVSTYVEYFKAEGLTPEDLWNSIDREIAPRATKKEFAVAMRKMQMVPEDWKEWFNLRNIFKMLDFDGIGQLRLDDLQYLETWARQRSLAPEVPVAEGDADGRPARYAAQVAEKRARIRMAAVKERARKLGSHDVRGFRKILETRFGSVVNAWLGGLDTDGNGRLTLQEFTRACRTIGYVGSISSLWSELDRAGQGFILLRDLDREAGDAIDTLKAKITEIFGSVDRAWYELLDADGSARVDRNEFVDGCKAMGINSLVANRIYGCIDADGSGCITRDELSFLDCWGEERSPLQSVSTASVGDKSTYLSDYRARAANRQTRERLRRCKTLPSIEQPWRAHDAPAGFYKKGLGLLAQHDERFATFAEWSADTTLQGGWQGY